MNEWPQKFGDARKEPVVKRDDYNESRYLPFLEEVKTEAMIERSQPYKPNDNFNIWLVDVRKGDNVGNLDVQGMNDFAEKKNSANDDSHKMVVEHQDRNQFKEKVEKTFSAYGTEGLPSVVAVFGEHGPAASVIMSAKHNAERLIETFYGTRQKRVEMLVEEALSRDVYGGDFSDFVKVIVSDDLFQEACIKYLEENDESDLSQYVEIKFSEMITNNSTKKISADQYGENIEKDFLSRILKSLYDVRGEYFNFEEVIKWDEKLITPVIIAVSEKTTFRSFAKALGADIILPKIEDGDLEKLTEFIASTKRNLASLRVDALRKSKKEFYQSVTDHFDERSEVTADTEQEIEILEEIFEKHGGVRKILDVGCGNGRVDLPLLKKGYDVKGIDADAKFLDMAREKARTAGYDYHQACFDKGDIIDYGTGRGEHDAVIYTWHSILEAFGAGNLLNTLNCAFKTLRKGGVLVFDQPTRENSHMEDGWYGNDPDSGHLYLSYVMTEEEIKFVLKIAGFQNVEIKKWKTKSSDEYPDGMHKFTVSAEKPREEITNESAEMIKGAV